MPRFLMFAITVFLNACQPAFINGMPNENSPYFLMPVDSTITLQKPVTVAANDDRVYFQDGEVVRWSSVNIYRSYCSLATTKKDFARTIAPETFAVTKTYTELFFQQAVISNVRHQVAALGWESVAQVGLDKRYEVMAMVMELKAAREPDIKRLICADWRLPPGTTSVTVNKIRRTLGNYFAIELAVPRASN